MGGEVERRGRGYGWATGSRGRPRSGNAGYGRDYGPQSSGIPALRRPATRMFSNGARRAGTLNIDVALMPAMLEDRSLPLNFRTSRSSAPARSKSPFRP